MFHQASSRPHSKCSKHGSHEDAPQGLLETSWLQRTGEDAPKDRERYLFTIDQGVQRNSSEVHIVQYQMSLALELPETLDWPADSTNKEREEWMVNELAQHLANTDGRGSVSLLAQGIGSASKVTLGRDKRGEPAITLGLPFNRAWASVGQALNKAEFNVLDLDRSSGKYYVSYQPDVEQEKPGFFARLFGAESQQANKEDYLLIVSDLGETVEIKIAGMDAQAIDSKKARSLLERIKGYLS